MRTTSKFLIVLPTALTLRPKRLLSIKPIPGVRKWNEARGLVSCLQALGR